MVNVLKLILIVRYLMSKDESEAPDKRLLLGERLLLHSKPYQLVRACGCTVHLQRDTVN